MGKELGLFKLEKQYRGTLCYFKIFESCSNRNRGSLLLGVERTDVLKDSHDQNGHNIKQNNFLSMKTI